MISVAAISNLHGNYDYGNIKYPEVELVIIAGDLCSSDNVLEQESEVPKILSALRKIFLGYDKIIIVPGNHDYWAEKLWRKQDSIEERLFLGRDTVLLIDTRYNYLGNDGLTYKIYGNPRTDLSLCAFPRLSDDIRKIPTRIDILVTHDCPRIHGMKCIKNSIGWYGLEEPGNKALADKVNQVKPGYHIFGHIHERCEYKNEATEFYNVSQMYKNSFSPGIKIIRFESSEIV